MRALLPISHSPEREVKPRRKFFLRQIQLLAQRPHGQHTASTRELRLGRWRSIWVRSSGSMTFRVAHGVEGAPICLWRLLRIELTAVDQADSVEAQLASGVEVIELDHVRVQEHLRVRPKVDTMLLPVGQLLGAGPFEVHREPRL